MAIQAQSAEGPETVEVGDDGVRRRDFLNVAAVSFAKGRIRHGLWLRAA